MMDAIGKTHLAEFSRDKLRTIVWDNDGQKTEMLENMIPKNQDSQTSICLM